MTVPVAFGIPIDASEDRAFIDGRVSERPRRELSLQIVRLNRSQATRHRCTYRVANRHRRVTLEIATAACRLLNLVG